MKSDSQVVLKLIGNVPVRVLKGIKIGNRISDFDGKTGTVKSIGISHFTNYVTFNFGLQDGSEITFNKNHPNPANTFNEITRNYYNVGKFIEEFNSIEILMEIIIAQHFMQGEEASKRFKILVLRRMDVETKRLILKDIFKEETFNTNEKPTGYFNNITNLISDLQKHRNLMAHNRLSYTSDMNKQAFALMDKKNPNVGIRYYLEDYIGLFEDALYLQSELNKIYKNKQ